MRTTEELLIAYADGELSGEELKRAEALLKSRRDLAAFIDQQRALRQNLGAAFAPVLDAPVPDHLLAALEKTPVSWRWRLRHALAWPSESFSTGRLVFWSGVPAAMGLACGIILALAWLPESAFRVEQGAMIVHGALAAALDRQLTSETGGNIRVGLSFKSKDGRYCRTFEREGASSSLAGVACHDASGWSVTALAATPPETAPYRMASSMPDTIRETVEQLIAGEPLDASQERRARDHGWQTP